VEDLRKDIEQKENDLVIDGQTPSAFNSAKDLLSMMSELRLEAIKSLERVSDESKQFEAELTYGLRV
jgi:hypothetical protein